jgi:hypothetical protein
MFNISKELKKWMSDTFINRRKNTRKTLSLSQAGENDKKSLEHIYRRHKIHEIIAVAFFILLLKINQILL